MTQTFGPSATLEEKVNAMYNAFLAGTLVFADTVAASQVTVEADDNYAGADAQAVLTEFGVSILDLQNRTEVGGTDAPTPTSDGTDVTVQGTSGGGTSGSGGGVQIKGKGGKGNGKVSGSILIEGGDAISGNADGGNVTIRAGDKTGTGKDGQVIFDELPVVDPGIADPTLVGKAIWLNSGVLTISAGT